MPEQFTSRKRGPLRVILARHGETALNVEKRFRGRADAPLTAKGMADATRLGQALVRWMPNMLIASPRRRALATADKIAACTGVAPTTDARLEDIDYGEWTGLSRTEVATKWPAEYDAYLHRPESASFPGGESILSVETRIASLLSELSHDEELAVVVLVTHDIVIRTLVCRLLDAPLSAMHRLRVDVTSTTAVSLASEETTVDWVNDVSHLNESQQ